jgi:hypothetical protein
LVVSRKWEIVPRRIDIFSSFQVGSDKLLFYANYPKKTDEFETDYERKYKGLEKSRDSGIQRTNGEISTLARWEKRLYSLQ